MKTEGVEGNRQQALGEGRRKKLSRGSARQALAKG